MAATFYILHDVIFYGRREWGAKLFTEYDELDELHLVQFTWVHHGRFQKHTSLFSPFHTVKSIPLCTVRDVRIMDIRILFMTQQSVRFFLLISFFLSPKLRSRIESRAILSDRDWAFSGRLKYSESVAILPNHVSSVYLSEWQPSCGSAVKMVGKEKRVMMS